jgi:type VI secretion system protein ImpF
MAELSLRERLQPALFDRLIDDERMLTQYELAVSRAELERLGLSERALTEILTAQGLVSRAATAPSPTDPERLVLRFSAPAGRVALAQLRALLLKPPGAPQGIALQSLCEIAARNVSNDTIESADRRSVSMRRLREYVCRDLAALLNCGSLDASVDLSAFPQVQRSVLNYGMPSLAGRGARNVDAQVIAERIAASIAQFEPRLSRVRVTPEVANDGAETHLLAFRIEAELWGQPAPLQLVLRTSIDVDSGDVKLTESAAA